MMKKKFTLLVILCVYTVSFTFGQLVTVTPNEYTHGMNNPYMGFRNGISNAPSSTNWKKNEYHTIYRHYIRWRDIENNENDGVQKIRDFCNIAWNGGPAANVTFIPRVYVDWDSNQGNEYWPEDILQKTGLQPHDPALWAHPIVKERVVKLIAKLGEAWDNDPRVAWVQTGILGYWGEQEKPVGVGQDGWARRLGDAYAAAFKNKKVIVRNQPDWAALGYKWGVYWDSYGHPGQRTGAWKRIQEANADGRWLTNVVEGEVAYDWGLDKLEPLYGVKPWFTLNNYKFTNNMIDVIKELHCTGLGWISSYLNYPSSDASLVNRDTIIANASRIQKEFGYRFVMKDFTCPRRTEPGELFSFSFKVQNTASAPFYYKWPLQLVFIDESSRLIVQRVTVHNVDVSSWLPGDNYNYNTRRYIVRPQDYLVEGTVRVPANLAKGKYLIGINILEPSRLRPGIFFAMQNFFKESQTQPIVRIGVGEDAPDHLLTGVRFDDPKRDDARNYLTTKSTYNLNITPSVHGTVNRLSAYPTLYSGDAVTITAVPNEGYEFESWGGDVIGNQNPMMVFMTSNLNVTANFKVKTSIGAKNIANSRNLGQNYPNPFSTTTMIPFEVSSQSFVRIDIYNIQGQKVKSLVNKHKDSGKYLYEWDGLDGQGRNLVNGMYVYQLVLDNENIAEAKLLVLNR